MSKLPAPEGWQDYSSSESASRSMRQMFVRYIVDWPRNGEDSEVITHLNNNVVRVVLWQREDDSPASSRTFLGEEIYPSTTAALNELARLGGVSLHQGDSGEASLLQVWETGGHISSDESKSFALRMIAEGRNA